MIIVPILITAFGILLLLFALKHVRQSSSLLAEHGGRNALVPLGILFFVLLTTYFIFALFFAANFEFRNTNSVISLVLALGAVYFVIISNVSVIVRTVSERKLAQLDEANSRLRQLARAKDQFVLALTHEVGSIVSSLEEALPDKGGKRDAVAGEMRRLASLVTDVKELAELDFGKVGFVPEVLELGKVIDRLKTQCDPLARNAGVRASYDVSSPLLSFEADKEKLDQVLATLFINAVHYTSRGGAVRVSAGHVADETLFSIRGEGSGIPKKMLPHIFERFYEEEPVGAERRVPGTGLGMAIAKSLVEAMGGRIRTESHDGDFAFHVSFPLKDWVRAAAPRLPGA